MSTFMKILLVPALAVALYRWLLVGLGRSLHMVVLVGVVIAAQSRSCAWASRSVWLVKLGAGPLPWRLTLAATSKRPLPSIAGTCWSAAILPKPMMAVRSGFISAPR